MWFTKGRARGGRGCFLRTVDQELGGHASPSPTEQVLGQAGVVPLEVLRHEEQREAAGRQVVPKGLGLGIRGLEPPLNHGRRPGAAGAAEVHLGAPGGVEGAIGEHAGGGDVDFDPVGAAWE